MTVPEPAVRRRRRFTVSPSRPIGIATDLLFSISRRVNTAFCPCGVRSPGVCLVSATQVLDHGPSCPAESCCISLSHCCPGSGRARRAGCSTWESIPRLRISNWRPARTDLGQHRVRRQARVAGLINEYHLVA
jgi:hypothetical protein